MNAVLLGSASWPNLHYFYHFSRAQGVQIEQHDTYGKQSFRNRYEILSANGILPLSIPVKRTGRGTKTKDIRIDYSSAWQAQHWGALTSAYRNSPFFRFFEADIRPFFAEKTDFLLDYNMGQLRLISNLLQLDQAVELSRSFEKSPVDRRDLRESIHPKKRREDDPVVAGFLKKKYYQTFGDKFGFVPNLSILDILFNLGVKARAHMQAG